MHLDTIQLRFFLCKKLLCQKSVEASQAKSAPLLAWLILDPENGGGYVPLKRR
jgi:hypothetical protein